MTSSGLEVARARKCRGGQSLCGYCAGMITLGQREVEVRGQGWWHQGCLLKARTGTWSDCYLVPGERKKAAEAERALGWLRSRGGRIVLPVHESSPAAHHVRQAVADQHAERLLRGELGHPVLAD